MINNRQNGRRRGRGGTQVRGPNNGSDRGNRIDNRARGNAVQLHEKYRNLARDAQTQGDRVMTEYYLQFADHYFRVLAESRARFEEQGQGQQHNQNRQQRYDANDFDGEGDGEEYGDEGEPIRADGNQQTRDNRYEQAPQQREGRDRPQARDDRPQREDRQPREDRQAREDRPQREERAPRREYQPRREQAAEAQPDFLSQPAAETREPLSQAEPEQVAERPRRGRPRRRPEAEAAGEEAPHRIEVDRLPPAFAPEPEAARGDDEAEPAPRKRRTRRPAANEDSDVAA